VKSIAIISFLLLVGLNVFGQEDIVETFEDEEQIDYPNKIGADSENDFFYLSSFNVDPCKTDGIIIDKSLSKNEQDSVFSNRVNNISVYEDSILISGTFNTACCSSFILDIEVDSLNNLNLKLTPYGNECWCTCCYGMTYVLKPKKEFDRNFHLLINSKELKYGLSQLNLLNSKN
jgi:hypothetical protein